MRVRVDRARAWRLLATLALASVPAVVGRDAIESAARLFPLASGPHPYFVPGHAILLYVWVPLVAVSACVLMLAPGLLAAVAAGSSSTPGRWVASGFALSTVGLSVSAAVMQGVGGSPLRGASFIGLVAALSILAFGAMWLRTGRGVSLSWPLASGSALGLLVSMVAVPMSLVAALAPKFLWESFNGDGAHAYEAARLLLFRPLPFWDAAAGEVAQFPGIDTMLFAFPASWFIRLFGEFEASARFPYLLFLVVLFGLIVELSRPSARAEDHASGSSSGEPRAVVTVVMWLGLVVYTVVMAFSATYSPYSADIALPATQDTLLVACFLAFVLTFVRKNRGWMSLWIVLTYLALPSGVLLIGFWLAAVMVWRERPWREVAVTAVVLVLCVAVAAVAPAVLRASGLPVPGSEYDAGGILRYFSVVQFSDWRRMLFVVLPGGIVPALALLAWRSHDEVARALSLVTAAYFLFFFVQAHVALHHFVPAMVLPLAVFWRLYWRAGHRSRRRALALAGVAGVTAFWLSLPKDATPYIAPVAIGRAVDDRMGGYEGGDPRAYARAELLSHALPYDWDPQVPERSLGGSPLVWRYYTARARAWNETDHAPAYVIQPLADPAPADSVRVADDDEAALYVTDPVTHASHVALRPPTPAGSRVYEIRRGILFRSEVLESGPRVINVRDVLEHWGVPLPGRFRSTGSDE